MSKVFSLEKRGFSLMYVTIPTTVASDSSRPNGMRCISERSYARVKAGEYLYFEGDLVENMYEVRSGVLRLTRLLEDGRRQVIAFGYAGDLVGFPSEGSHHADCDVLMDARLRPIHVSNIESGNTNPDLHSYLVQAALMEIAAMQDHFMMLGRKSAQEKVASFLTTLAQRVGQVNGGTTYVNLPMSRADIADFLGLTTETVSRTLTQLRKTGLISIHQIHTVTILRPDALTCVSKGQKLLDQTNSNHPQFLRKTENLTNTQADATRKERLCG
jgi:CRP/FNR family transcriptional regulator